MNLLKVPSILSRCGFDGDHRRGEQIVSRPDPSVEIRSRVAGGEIDQPELRIDGRCLPDGTATVEPCLVVLRPGVVTDLSRPGDRIEGPEEVAILRVEGLDAPARAVFAAGKSDDHHSF